jgi:hypothetical protein
MEMSGDTLSLSNSPEGLTFEADLRCIAEFQFSDEF